MADRLYSIKDTMVVVVLTKLEAKALYERLQQHTGIAKSIKGVIAEEKIKRALEAL